MASVLKHITATENFRIIITYRKWITFTLEIEVTSKFHRKFI